LNSSGVVANAFDGDVDTIDQQTAPNGYIGINYGQYNEVYAGSIGILPGVSGSFHVLLEWSNDGVTWNLLEDTGVTTWVDNEWLWYDIDPGQTCQILPHARDRRQHPCGAWSTVGNNSTEVTMARLNRDDYTNLPEQELHSQSAVPILAQPHHSTSNHRSLACAV
jgi:hypothetical protein